MKYKKISMILKKLIKAKTFMQSTKGALKLNKVADSSRMHPEWQKRHRPYTMVCTMLIRLEQGLITRVFQASIKEGIRPFLKRKKLLEIVKQCTITNPETN